MMRKTLIIGLAGLLMAPPAMLVAVGAVANPATLSCVSSSMSVETVPGNLQVPGPNGARVSLDKDQVAHAATIITVGGKTPGVNRSGIQIGLMAALTESGLHMDANPTYQQSLTLPHDGVGSDHDSLGMFQMRPASGWGTVANLMNPEFQARAFFGGPTGPNYPSPRGLLDIPGWQTLPLGAAAQAVEVSAYPDRYAAWQQAADTIIDALTSGSGVAVPPTPGMQQETTPSVPGSLPIGNDNAASPPVVFPLPAGSWVASSPFGMRLDPVTKVFQLHAGADFAAPDGTPIMSATNGTVTIAGAAAGFGQEIRVDSVIDGQLVSVVYGHMWPGHLYVKVAGQVSAGQHIADVGANGQATGPHLHFEVHPGGGAPVDPVPWLAGNHAGNQQGPSEDSSGCYVNNLTDTRPDPTPVSTPAVSSSDKGA